MYNAFLYLYLVIELKDTEFMPEYIGNQNYMIKICFPSFPAGTEHETDVSIPGKREKMFHRKCR